METSTPTVTSTPVNALWLDTFKDRGPVLFDGINRTPAIEDVRNVLIYISFTTLFVAFLIIFPGIRKEVSDTAASSPVHSLPLNCPIATGKQKQSCSISLLCPNSQCEFDQITGPGQLIGSIR